MKPSNVVAFIAAAVIGFSFGGCNCPGTNDQDAGEDAGPDAGFCADAGASCSADQPCCGFNACVNGTCVPTCTDPGLACTTNSQCCFNRCLADGTCGAQCNAIGATCTGGGDCCTGNCDSTGHCADIPGRPITADGGSACDVRGDQCTDSSECCSHNCKQGTCAPAYSCAAYNDICGSNSECCSLSCSVNDGGSGFCVTVTGGGAGSCWPTGNPCDAGTDCCTTVCANLGSGTTVCQPVQGCQVAGDNCTSTSACCGGQPNGDVQCRTSTNRCDQGTNCREPGNICGKPTELDGGVVRRADGTQWQISSETNCCNGINGPIGSDLTCHLDNAGVPRCFGVTGDAGACPIGYTGQAPCCIDTGNYCNFRDQCCNGALCADGPDGGRQCLSATCSGIGTPCDPTDAGPLPCCTGTACLPTSEVTYACQIPSDGGGGGCLSNGATCASAGQCCSQICNASGQCEAPPTCQPEGTACTLTADCCPNLGLVCDVPTGGGGGVCVKQVTDGGAPTCPISGQACSPTNLCCDENTVLDCLSTVTGVPCDGTTACTCNFIIGAKGPGQVQ